MSYVRLCKTDGLFSSGPQKNSEKPVLAGRQLLSLEKPVGLPPEKPDFIRKKNFVLMKSNVICHKFYYEIYPWNIIFNYNYPCHNFTMSAPSSPDALNISDLPSLPTISPGMFSNTMNLPPLPSSTQTVIDLTSPPRKPVKRKYDEVIDLTTIIEEEKEEEIMNHGYVRSQIIAPEYDETEVASEDDATIMSTDADDGKEPLLWDVAGKERWM